MGLASRRAHYKRRSGARAKALVVRKPVRYANGAQLRGKLNRSLKPYYNFQSIGLAHNLRFPRASLYTKRK
jgi:hypothetical protein